MSASDVADAQPTLDRIGAAADRITQAGHYAIADAVVAHTRQLRGALRRVDTSVVSGHGVYTGQRIARELMELAEGCERLADTLASSEGAQTPER